jgi:hypothetical protein
MSENKKPSPLATTFTPDEVTALDALLKAAREGKDTSVIVRSEAITNAHRKFLKLREKARGRAS